MMRRLLLVAVALLGLAAGLHLSGVMPLDQIVSWDKLKTIALPEKAAEAAPRAGERIFAPAVSVARVKPREFTETVLVTGTLVAREEILVGPEIEGLRVLEVMADEGDRVVKGQPLAKLVQVTLEAQVAQNDASLARAAAAVAQAESSITQAEARVAEARNAFERAKPLRQSGYLAESVFDQRESAARTADSQLVAARDGLKVAIAEREQVEAQRRELDWRRARTDVMAPADGIVSRRNARIGAMASSTAEPMFRIVAKGEVELDAEVAEASISKLREGQTAKVEVAGLPPVDGTVRLVSPEVDKATRLGRVRISLGDKPGLRVGAFGRATIETASGRGLAVPASAVLYSDDGATTVLVVIGDRVETRAVKLGLASSSSVQVSEGLREGEVVVAKSGTFLRGGDVVRPVHADDARTSEVRS